MSIRDADKNREYQREWARRKYADGAERARRKARVNTWKNENPDRVQVHAKKSRAKARQEGKTKLGTTHRREQVRAWLRNYKELHPCSCGQNDPDCLEFHHVDPAKKKFSIGAGRGYSLGVVKAEVAKCVVICADCHTEVHRKMKGM